MPEHAKDELERRASALCETMERLAVDIRLMQPSPDHPLYRLSANLEWTTLQYRRASVIAARKEASRRVAEEIFEDLGAPGAQGRVVIRK